MRIVTRPDFDGVVCAVLISDTLEIREPVHWVEPSQINQGTAGIQPGDIIANLPFDPRCAIWFDHHATNLPCVPYQGLFRNAPSAARNVFDYFHGRFRRDYDELVYWADRIDSADFSQEEVRYPEKHNYVLLSMTVSGEHGQEKAYWNDLVRLLRESDIQRIMAEPEVEARCRRVIQENAAYAEWLRKHTRIEGPVAITDFRALDHPPSGNRFLAYCLFPETVVSLRIRYEDRHKKTVVVNVGHNIFNPHCRVHVGRLMAEFEGGGHRGAASTRFPAAKAESYLPQIISTLVQNRPNPKAD
jgi:hypothetical protein